MQLEQYFGFLNTPPLWTKKQFDIPQFAFPEIDLEQFEAEQIPKNFRLGHQMERVFAQLIDHSSDYQILAQNLPIRNGKNTLGEIDFILKDTVTEQLLHVELTYKFYLINPDIKKPLMRLIGPNKRDTFNAKMEKIKRKQFPLIHSKESSKTIKELDLDHNRITSEACFKAQLYVPYDQLCISVFPFNKHCVYGYWLTYETFNTFTFQAYKYYIPSKSEWIISPHKDVIWHSHSSIKEVVKSQLLQMNSPMLWVKKAENTFEKFFVVWH